MIGLYLAKNGLGHLFLDKTRFSWNKLKKASHDLTTVVPNLSTANEREEIEIIFMFTHTNIRHLTAKSVVSMSSEKKIYLLRVLV